ncbi:hypothetical protein, variant [Blastomyces gilchristii SLH14081]|uniref:Uncharacterized protein n=2 Tax=Blastomyces TaxID=229219 RepID=A0A179UJB0_BLAGS|nr:hypothetical protein, variant [Blastomyces gilchristii SLH14081]EGE83156.2 hypothetical protein BDDG_06100 [Blastomyces dermatitidis ATCC 18188]EQL28714.1 hypothetical protein, variant [Blastomyces dermatitidis ATCC 26199]OAT08074.1 hypothetical protein, variant [Blastomyces gilchristii SLH14081]
MFVSFRRPAARHRKLKPLACALLLCTFLTMTHYIILRFRISVPPPTNLVIPDSFGVPLAIVMGKTKGENANWAYSMFPEWTPFVYSVDDEPGYGLRVPNRGRESMPYLTFIIDHYHSLPDIVAFVHANNRQWHNQDIGYYNDHVLRRLRLETVRERGYVNLRCRNSPGCEPSSVLPHNPSLVEVELNDTRSRFANIYAHLFEIDDVKEVPHVIGSVCCAQFVVTRERILQRPLSDYERMRSWVLSGSRPMNDYDVGWVFEKLWHVIFGQPPVYCISESQCLCELYGKCGPPGPRELKTVFEPVS